MAVQAMLSDKVSESREILNGLQKAAQNLPPDQKIEALAEEKIKQVVDFYNLTCETAKNLQQVIGENADVIDESAQVDISRLAEINKKISKIRFALFESYKGLQDLIERDAMDEESSPNSPDLNEEIFIFDEDELKKQEGASSERVRSGDRERLPKAKSKARGTGVKKTKKGKAKGSREKPLGFSKMHPLPQTASLAPSSVKDQIPCLSENPERLWEKGLELQDLFIKRGQIGDEPLAGEVQPDVFKHKRPQDRGTLLLPRLEEIFKSSLETIANMSKWALQTLPRLPAQLPALLPRPPEDLGEVEMKTLFIPEPPNQIAADSDWVSTAKKTMNYLLDMSRSAFENGRNRLLGPPDPPSLNPDGF
jgi:hypothetical protein